MKEEYKIVLVFREDGESLSEMLLNYVKAYLRRSGVWL
jgi:hypothetical protein